MNNNSQIYSSFKTINAIGDKMRTLVIIPAYNEAKNIERVVDNLIQNYSQYEYVIINDGSTDNTAKVCIEKGYNLINLPINLGLAGAFQTGMKYAYLKGFDAAIQFDGDGQHDPRYIAPMLREIESRDVDIVIGSRFKDIRKPFGIRMLGSRMIQAAIRLTTGKKVTDPTSGMRMYDRLLLEEFANNLNYGPEPDTLAYLLRFGAKVKEVQVEMSERIYGKSYLSVTRSIIYMVRICTSILLIQWFRKRDDIQCLSL